VVDLMSALRASLAGKDKATAKSKAAKSAADKPKARKAG
jgi:non-homologous end joining protein Ku